MSKELHEHREVLEELAESELAIAWIAQALLDVMEETDP